MNSKKAIGHWYMRDVRWPPMLAQSNAICKSNFGQAKTSKCFHTPQKKKEEIIAKMVA